MKRIISFVLCLSMLLSMAPVRAFAADVEETTAPTEVIQAAESTAATEETAVEATDPDVTTSITQEAAQSSQAEAEASQPEETIPEETEETYTATGFTWVPDMELPSNEALFAGYAEHQLYGTGISTLGTAGRETLDDGQRLIYDALASEIRKIASGDRDSAVIAVGNRLGDVPVRVKIQETGEIVDVTCPCYTTTEIDVSAVDLNIQTLLDVLLADFPYELYWFDKTAGVSALYVSSSSSGGCYVFYFAVSAEYRQNTSSGTYYNAADYEVKTARTGAASRAAANAQAIAEKYKGATDYEKLAAYKDEIRSLTSYNSSAASPSYSGGYGDPWQLIWVFDEDPDTKVVCEGYSKAFQYLCDLSEFDNKIVCYNVVGYLNPTAANDGDHMWNIVTVNGSSYLVDVTNTTRTCPLFLRGGTAAANGSYTFSGQKFVYRDETKALWGTGADSILTLAAEDLTEANFPEAPGETEPSEPETEPTEPTEPEEPSAMTGEELVAALKACTTINYELAQPVVISSAIELPNNAMNVPGIVNVCGNGSITVKKGGSLTFANTLDFADGGTLTVETGGNLAVNGCLCVGVGGAAVIDGNYTLGETSRVVVNYPGSITGIKPSAIHFIAFVWDEASLADTLRYQGYASHEVDIPGYDMDGDGSPDPVVLTKDLTIPEDWTLLIGDELGAAAVLQIADGITLTNSGTLAVMPGASLILGDGALLTGSGTIGNDGTITSCGTIEGTVEGNGILTEYMSPAQFLALLDSSNTFTVSRPLTLTGTVTIPDGKYIYFEKPGCLTVADGATLTVEGNLTYIVSSLTVQSGGSLVLQDEGRLDFIGGSALTIEAGASYAIEDEAEIYADQGTALTGITKAEVTNSNSILDPATSLQAFAEEFGSGYKKFYLSIATDYTVSGDMTLPANVVLEHYGNTVTITNGATLTVNGHWKIGMEAGTEQVGGHIVIEDGALVTNGTLELTHGSSLTIAEGGTFSSTSAVTVDANSSLVNEGEVTIDGELTLDGSWSGNPPEDTESGTLPGTQDFFENMLSDAAASGSEAHLTYDVALTRSLLIDCTLVIGEGTTLTVPRGISLVNNGQIILMENAALVVNGKLLGNLPCLTSTTSRFTYAEGSLSFTQTTLEAQLDQSAQTGMPVSVSVPLTLTKDLVIPEGAQMLLTGGVITIPTERSLTNNGIIQMTLSGGITAQGSGTLANNGTITVFNRGVLDLTYGFYECSDSAELLGYFNEGSGTGVGTSVIGDIYQYVTFLVEGRNEDQIHDIMGWAESFAPIKALQVNVCGDLTLTKNLVLPEYATLFVGDPGYGPANLTVPKNITLTNNGSIEIGQNGNLTVKSGAILEGSLPVCLDETAVYVNENSKDQAYLASLLASGTAKLTAPVIITGTLEIPVGTTLTISGKGASLVLDEGATLINRGTIQVEHAGILDVTRGSYISGGTVYNKSTCDADGNVAHATVLGVDLGDMTLVAETASEDAIIRERIAYVSSLVESGGISDPEEGGFFTIRFVGDTVLSDDLELPFWSDPIIPANGSVTVPEGMTLTDHSGMAVYGTLSAEGQVIATGFPFLVDNAETLVHPENCTNYYIAGKALEGITVGTSATTAKVNYSIQLWIDDWAPIDAEYFGAYDVAILEDTTGSAGCGWLDGNTVTVYAYTPGTVTVELLPIVGYDCENNYEPIYSEHTGIVTLNFVDAYIYLYTEEDEPDFFEEGYLGLYPGSSLHFYGNLTNRETDVDRTLDWSWPEVSEDIASVSLTGGVLTITASETLTEAAAVAFTVRDPSGFCADFQYEVRLRPRATAVDVALNGEAVTGQTVLFDVNRGRDTVQLSPVTTPADACNAYGLMADGETPLVQWKSSSESIATVDGSGHVTFTGRTGKVKITMTASFGSKKTAAMTFNVVALAQEIFPSKTNADTLIGGSSATYTVTDGAGTALKSSAVKWFLCDKDGKPVTSHPYASITAAGKLTTKAVADEINVYLMAQVVGDEDSACLSEPVLVELYPAVSFAAILGEDGNPINGTTQPQDGDSYQLDWTAEPYLESVKSVSWKSSASTVATISKDGLITVLKPGTAKFTLTVTALNNKKTTATVTMKFGIFTEDLLLSATLPDKRHIEDLSEYLSDESNVLSIYSGESITFAAKNVPNNVTTAGVKWSVDNKSLATVSSSGLLKAKTVSNPETVTVFVESKDGVYDGVYRNEGIFVRILPKPKSVVIWNEDEEFITKTTQTLELGESLQLEASEDVTWSSNKASVASVDEDGCVTALATGTATITAKTADNRKAAVTVKVTEVFESMSITTKKNVDFEVASGKSLELVGTVVYGDGSKSTKVTWSVSDASLATISSSGKLTAAKGLTRPATVRVYATVKDSGWSTSKLVRILPLTTAVEIWGPFGTSIHDVDISNTTQKWDLTTQGTELTLSARTFPSGAMENVTWKSSSTKTATIDQDGKVQCLKAGTTTITATAGDGSGKKATFKLTVHRTMRADTLQLSETAIIAGGKSLTMAGLKDYRIDPEATNKTLTWTLTYPNGTAVPSSIATLSNKGVLKTKAVTVPVTLYVTAAATDGSGETARCAVTIYPATKGITLYNADMESVNKKTVSVPVSEGFTILPDTTNVSGFDYNDDKTADEYLANGTAWDISLSKDIARVEFDGQAMTVYAIGEPVGQSVKITLKATDGSNKSAYFTVKFTEAAPG